MISAGVLKALAAAGATTEMIIAAVEAEEAAITAEREARLTTKRAADAERQRRSRLSRSVTRDTRKSHMSRVTSVTEPQDLDLGDPVQPTSSSDEKWTTEGKKKGGSHVLTSSSLEESSRKEGREELVTRAIRTPVEFGKFWEAYPHKVGKADALKKFQRARKVVEFDELMAGLARYAAKTDDRNWCNPSTWLHQQRWTDKPAPPVQRKHRSWKDERAENNYRASQALNRFVFGDGADDQAAGEPPGDADARFVLDLEPAQPSGLHAGAGHDADEIPFFNRRAGMRNGS